MECDLKLLPWDLAELERGIGLSIGSMVGSSSGLGHHVRGKDFSIDLKLGGLGDLGSSANWKEQPRVLRAMPPSSRASKRARAPSNGSQTVSCLVDGCVSDLSKCREYHRRHKVCEVHSKTAVVMVGGREQRFCQQCSRFHLLTEFDDVKRSCRKRLDGHNRRRRKPQPDYITTASLIINQQGTGFSSYPQIFPTARPECNWIYTHHPPLHSIVRQQNLPSSTLGYKEEKQFPFLQDGAPLDVSRTLGTSIYHAEHKTVAPSESSSKIFTDGIIQVFNSNCALSLLSSPSPSETSAINLSPIVPGDSIPMGQSLASGLQYGGLGRYSRLRASNTVSPTGFSCLGMEDGSMGTGFVPNASDADLQCRGMFHAGVEGSSGGAYQALPPLFD